MQSEVAAVLDSATRSGRLTPRDKRWITQKMKEQKMHDMKIEIVRAIGNNPDLPFIIGLAGGGAVATLGEIVDSWPPGKTGDAQEGDATDVSGWLIWLLTGGPGGIVGAAVYDKFVEALDGNATPQNIFDMITRGAKTAGISLSAFCAVILVYRSVFGGEQGGGQGMGQFISKAVL